MTSSLNLATIFCDSLSQHISIIGALADQQELFEHAAKRMAECLQQGHKVLWCGNGGSAAEAQHLAAELVGRFQRDRRALPSLALTTDSAVLTAIGNDHSYDQVFVRQIEALCSPDDVVVALSTSGRSKNVCLGLRKARELGAFTIAMTGQNGSTLATHADVNLRVSSGNVARIQEAHMLFGHALCEWVEAAVCISQALADAGDAA